MNLSKIKTQIESNQKFKSYNKYTDLSFNDFSIYVFTNKSKQNVVKLKEGSNVGNFNIYINDDNSIHSVHYDMCYEGANEKRLKKLGLE